MIESNVTRNEVTVVMSLSVTVVMSLSAQFR